MSYLVTKLREAVQYLDGGGITQKAAPTEASAQEALPPEAVKVKAPIAIPVKLKPNDKPFGQFA